jgi:two-component system, NtrC family, sensor kinase
LSSTTSDVRIRILVVDDEPDILLGLNVLLEQRGHYVKTFHQVASALEHLTSAGTPQYDLLITDYRMPGGISGLDLAKRVKKDTRRRRRRMKVFLITAFDISSSPEFAEALEAEVVDEVLQKPIPNDKLIAIIEKSFLHNNH